jgi:predicted nucleic acid-binding protein
MYAAGGPHPLRDACRTALESAVEKRVRLVTSSEVLQEILYRYFSLRKPQVAQAVYAAATRLCDEVLGVEEKHTARALELLLASPGLSPRDAIHVATMESARIRRILTADQDFDGVASVERIDPADFP